MIKRTAAVFIVVVACAAGIVHNPAHAERFVYEGFDYAFGDLAGNDGGVGWSGAWIDAGGDVNAEVLAQGLAFTSGNGEKYVYRTGRCAAFLSAPGNTTQCRYQRNIITHLDSDVEFWASYLNKTLSDTDDGESCFAWGFDPGENIAQFNWVIGSGKKHNMRALVNRPYTFDSFQAPTGGALSNDTTYFVVGKIKLWKGAEGEMYVRAFDITWWRYQEGVDDISTNALASGGVRRVGTGSRACVLMRLCFSKAHNDNTFTPFVINEIRAGYAYEEVVPLALEPAGAQLAWRGAGGHAGGESGTAH
ncbi:MAG: hypothetical protein N2595_09590 [bacterium]|nr:hypothetical protein [bacterium]